MSDAPCIQPFRFGNARYKGERVVSFEATAGMTSSERNAQVLATPPALSHGSLKGLLIQEREDAARPRPGLVDRHATFWAARDWALHVGFSDAEVFRAARAALDLRREHGGGNVTKAMVLELMCAGDAHGDAELLAAWDVVDRRLQEVVDESTYRIWLEGLSARHFVADTWMLECHPEHVAWIGERFGQTLEAAAGCSVMIVACEP